MNTKDLILKNAAECFSRTGYRGTSMQVVARQAGVNVAVIYRYYKSKRELFEAVGQPGLDFPAPARREKEHHILRAALCVFSRRGFNAATLDEIAQHAGLTKGGLYAYFPSKEALFDAVLEHPPLMQEITPALSQLLSSANADAETCLTTLAEAYLAAFEKEEVVNLLRVILSEGVFNRNIAERFLQSAVKGGAAQIGAALAPLLGREAQSLGGDLQFFFGMLSAWMLVNRILPQAEPQAPSERHEIARKMSRLFLYGLQVNPA